MLIVDASVLVPLLVDEVDTAAAKAMADDESDLIAPDLIVAEALKVLWKKQRLGQIDHAMRFDAVTLIGPPLVRLVAMLPLARRASALADQEGVPLVTADRRLIAKVVGARRGALVLPVQSFASAA